MSANGPSNELLAKYTPNECKKFSHIYKSIDTKNYVEFNELFMSLKKNEQERFMAFCLELGCGTVEYAQLVHLKGLFADASRNNTPEARMAVNGFINDQYMVVEDERREQFKQKILMFSTLGNTGNNAINVEVKPSNKKKRCTIS